MALLFNGKMQRISRQVLLSWKHLAVQRCVTTLVGQSQKFVRWNTSVKQNFSFMRYLTSSSSCQDVKQLASETVCTDDDALPAEILSNLSPEDEKRLKVLKLEYDVFMSTGVRVPDHVGDEDWVYLLHKCHSPRSREKYYRYLFKREKSSEADSRARAANRLANEEKRKLIDQQKLEGTYEFINRFSMITRETTMNRWYSNNLCYALMNGPHLVFDFSYEEEMNDHEITNLVRQVSSHSCSDAVVLYTVNGE